MDDSKSVSVAFLNFELERDNPRNGIDNTKLGYILSDKEASSRVRAVIYTLSRSL